MSSMTSPDLEAIVSKLTEGAREGLLGAFETSNGGMAPAFSTGSVFELQRHNLARSNGVWADLTDLGLQVRAYLQKEQSK